MQLNFPAQSFHRELNLARLGSNSTQLCNETSLKSNQPLLFQVLVEYLIERRLKTFTFSILSENIPKKIRACEGSQPLVGARREVTFAEAREREALHINLIFPHRNEQTPEISLIIFFLTKKLLRYFANTFAKSTGFLARITLLNFL